MHWLTIPLWIIILYMYLPIWIVLLLLLWGRICWPWAPASLPGAKIIDKCHHAQLALGCFDKLVAEKNILCVFWWQICLTLLKPVITWLWYQQRLNCQVGLEYYVLCVTEKQGSMVLTCGFFDWIYWASNAEEVRIGWYSSWCTELISPKQQLCPYLGLHC